MSENKIAIEIVTINNGYLVTGHKVNGYEGADTGKTFYQDFEEMADDLVATVRRAYDLEIASEPESGLFGYPVHPFQLKN